MSKDTQPKPVGEVTIRSYRRVPQFSEETEAFTATIYLDGKKAGVATNRGQGAPNRYDFPDHERYTAFMAYAKAWGDTNGVIVEAADALIGGLCEDYQLANEARALLKLRANTVILVEKEPRWFTDDHSGDPAYYEDSTLLVVPDGVESATLAAERNAHTWRVIPTA
jgi:hypothetical protein